MPPIGAGAESANVKIIEVEPEAGSATLASRRKRSGGTATGVTVGSLMPPTDGSSVSTVIPPSAVTVPWLETWAIAPVNGLSTTTWKVIVTDPPAGRVPTFQVRLSPTIT